MTNPVPNSETEQQRRVTRLELTQSDLQSLLRENTHMTSLLNTTLVGMKEEFKQEFREMRQEMKVIREIELDIANLKLGFAAGKWLAGTVTGAIIAALVGLFFKLSNMGP